MIGGLALWRFYFQFHPGSIKSPQVIEFLKHLQRHVSGKLLILWDGAPIHRSRLVQDYVASTRGRITIERLPAYAPELNPVEELWNYLKYDELPNFAPRDVTQLDRGVNKKLFPLHWDQPRLRTFLANSPLKW